MQKLVSESAQWGATLSRRFLKVKRLRFLTEKWQVGRSWWGLGHLARTEKLSPKGYSTDTFCQNMWQAVLLQILRFGN